MLFDCGVSLRGDALGYARHHCRSFLAADPSSFIQVWRNTWLRSKHDCDFVTLVLTNSSQAVGHSNLYDQRGVDERGGPNLVD